MRLRTYASRELGAWRLALSMMVTSPLRTWTNIIACGWSVMFLVFFDSFLYELRTMNVEVLTKAAMNEIIDVCGQQRRVN